MRRSATALLVLALTATACGSNESTPSTQLADPPAATGDRAVAPEDVTRGPVEDTVEDEVAAAASGPVDVAIEDEGGFRFAPGDVTVAVGQPVRWTHQGAVSHTVSGGGLNSGTMMTGDVYEATFEEPGTFSYLCYFHGNMRGTVTVTP